MIVYFADRRLSILGLASTELDNGAYILDDTSLVDVETGTETLSLDIAFDGSNRKQVETMADAGNYILYKKGDSNKFFTIIDFTEDVDENKISLYAEEGGLDLLNDVAYPFYSDSEHNIEWYMERYLIDTGFEIKIDEMAQSDKTLALGWDSTSTITNRLASIAQAFEAEIGFGFDIEGLSISHKYVNVYKKRGKNVQSKLRLGKELSNLRITKSVADLATALDVSGGQDSTEIDLEGTGCILIGNDYAFGASESAGNGWVDSFYNNTNCMGYAIRQNGGDFVAKGNSSSTYPNKNYTECIQSFMSSSGSQNKTISVDGPRGYKLCLDLSWSVPTGTNPINVTYTLKILSGSTYRFAQFAIGWEVKIGGQNADIRPRSGAARQSIALNSSLTLCTGSISIPQTKDNISATALIDMATNRASDGVAVAPGPMNLSGSFKVVTADTEDEKKTIRYIIVGGGINDISSTKNASGLTAIKSGIDSFVSVAHELFPYARIYFVPLFSTIEGNIQDRTKISKTSVSRPNFTETQWLTYSEFGHEETWTGTSSNRGGAVTNDIFYVQGRSTDGGWNHTAIYSCTNDSGDLSGICVGHLVGNSEWLKEAWVDYARTKGVYTTSYSTDWFKGVSDYRPESGSSLLMNSSGYSASGQCIARVVAGWNGDMSSDSSSYSTTKYVTLEGKTYDDGDFYIDGTLLKSRNAVSKWTRFINKDTAYTNSYHLVKTFSYDTTNQDELLTKAIDELKVLREPIVGYEADILYLPPEIEVGDTVELIDELGEVYLSTRILQIEHSDTRDEDRITFGEFVRKQSGIAQMVYQLADSFKEQASKQTFHTWTVYADDNQGNNISLVKLPSSRYLGIATYRIAPEVDVTDPSVFKWTILDDSDSIIIKVSSSNGTYFMDTVIDTVLTAFVYVNGVLQTDEQVSQLGIINWYKDDSYVGTGSSFTISEQELINEGTYEARLEG